MKIALLGDLALFGKMSIENVNIYSYFSEVKQLLDTYDLVIANLESPLTSADVPYGYKTIHLKSDTDNIELLKYLNIGVVNLANNHILDFGHKGLNETIDLLTKNNIKYFGVDSKTETFNVGGVQLHFTGACCFSSNPYGIWRKKNAKRLNVFNPYEVEEQLRQQNEDTVHLYSIHFGQEHVNYPNNDHLKVFRKLTHTGKFILHGHHPHVLQGMEKYNDSILAYSLGNFAFDDIMYKGRTFLKQSENNKTSVILEIEINNGAMEYKAIPIFAGHERMLINKANALPQFNKKLKMDEEDYIHYRNTLLEEYVQNRKSIRNIKWYLERLRFTSAGIIFNSKMNYKIYEKLIKAYIKDEG